MRNPAGLALACLLSVSPGASAATAEPELLPFAPSARTAKPAAPRPAPRAEPAAPLPDPPKRDEVREKLRKGRSRQFLTIRSRAWLARSSVDTRYAIQIPRENVDPPADVFFGETEERDASGTMVLYSVELAPLSWLSAELEYGQDRARGRYTDRFWIHSPESDTLTNLNNGAVWHNPDHEDDEVFASAHTARRDWLSANAFFRVHEGRVTGSDETEVRHALDVSVGAHRFRQDSRFTSLERTVSTGKFFPAAPLGPIAGFESTYSAVWRGPHVGFREEMYVPLGFSFDALLLWSPVMEYRGDGYDNLAGGLRASSPNYSDRSHGTALHFRLGAAWSWSIVRFEAGYMRLAFKARRGTRRYYLNSGSGFDQALDQTTAEVSGLYAGGAVRF